MAAGGAGRWPALAVRQPCRHWPLFARYRGLGSRGATSHGCAWLQAWSGTVARWPAALSPALCSPSVQVSLDSAEGHEGEDGGSWARQGPQSAEGGSGSALKAQRATPRQRGGARSGQGRARGGGARRGDAVCRAAGGGGGRGRGQAGLPSSSEAQTGFRKQSGARSCGYLRRSLWPPVAEGRGQVWRTPGLRGALG